MKNEIQIFSNKQFGEVRTIDEGGKVYFCGKDVANALGYTIPRKAILDHCHKKGVLKRNTLTSGGRQQVIFIDEGNLYRLITHSKLPAAEAFEAGVFDEVLPSIRKTGGYMNKAKADQIKEQLAEARRNNAQARKASLRYKLAEKVNVDTYKQVLYAYSAQALSGEQLLPLPKAPSEKLLTAEDIAAELGISPQKVGRIANAHGIKNEANGVWVWDKSRSSNYQCQVFRYFPRALAAFRVALEVA